MCFSVGNLHYTVKGFVEQKFMLSSSFRCDQTHNWHILLWSHFVVLLKFFNKLTLEAEAGSLNKSSCLAPALGVAKFIIVTIIIFVSLCCAT